MLVVVLGPTLRRKLKADIAAAFPLLGADDLSELVPNKEELNVVKIYAHKGDAVTVYVLHKNPLFFELEKRLYPTGKQKKKSRTVNVTKYCKLCLIEIFIVMSSSICSLALPCSPSNI